MRTFLSDRKQAVPVRHSGFLDHTREKGRRMVWQFWFADGSSLSTYDTRRALQLTQMMMKAKLVQPHPGDAYNAMRAREWTASKTSGR